MQRTSLFQCRSAASALSTCATCGTGCPSIFDSVPHTCTQILNTRGRRRAAATHALFKKYSSRNSSHPSRVHSSSAGGPPSSSSLSKSFASSGVRSVLASEIDGSSQIHASTKRSRNHACTTHLCQSRHRASQKSYLDGLCQCQETCVSRVMES